MKLFKVNFLKTYMLFNSYNFLLFFPIVTVLFFLLPHRFRWFHLLTASFLFYMAFLPVYVMILAITIIVDYFAGIAIEKSKGKTRKQYLILSIVANVGFLALFKYYDFIILNLNNFLAVQIPLLKDLWLSEIIIQWNNYVNTRLNALFGTRLDILTKIVLPIGLSFHTFQAMSYTIEVYKGNQKSERHFGIYALYVMFYPQLVAGPIERPQNILHQFHEKQVFSFQNLLEGLRLMVWGLFKKVVIADRLAVYVNLVYLEPGHYHWLNVAMATLFFAIQIYCDFSGYSDMAIGAAKVMGFDLMINFNRPYFAKNIQVFWSKWHISLSTWFRDYLYIPLGGNRVPYLRFLLNIAIIFIVSGIWHGANWTFIIWGALHAVYQIVFLLWDRFATRREINRNTYFSNFMGWLITFVAVVFAWIFFRANNLEQAFSIIKQTLTFQANVPFKITILDADLKGGFGGVSLLISIFGCICMIFIEKYLTPKLVELDNRPIIDTVFIALTVTATILLGAFTKESFIYFQF